MTQIPPDPHDAQSSGPPSPPPPPPRPVLPIEYASEPPPRSSGAFVGRIFLGFVGYLVLSVGWWRFALRTRLRGDTSFILWGLMTAALLGLALHLRVRYRRAGYGYGILLALLATFLLAVGLVLLIIGLCAKHL